jgi:hypothetical protein
VRRLRPAAWLGCPGRARGRAAIVSGSSTATCQTTGFSAVLHFRAIAVSFGLFFGGVFTGVCITLVWIFAGV